MKVFSPDISAARSKRALGALAAALATAALSAGVAQAQSGGTTTPTETTPPPTTTAPTAPATPFAFPIPGPHTFGDGFGTSRGKRSHQGVDIFAACGSMEVAVASGTVTATGFQGAAGNYLIIRGTMPKRDYVYMHMAARPAVAKKQKVVAGQFVGAVGETGNASGCHLHFEMWKGKWYRGGVPRNPMPALTYWDSYS